MLASARLSCI